MTFNRDFDLTHLAELLCASVCVSECIPGRMYRLIVGISLCEVIQREPARNKRLSICWNLTRNEELESLIVVLTNLLLLDGDIIEGLETICCASLRTVSFEVLSFYFEVFLIGYLRSGSTLLVIDRSEAICLNLLDICHSVFNFYSGFLCWLSKHKKKNGRPANASLPNFHAATW